MPQVDTRRTLSWNSMPCSTVCGAPSQPGGASLPSLWHGCCCFALGKASSNVCFTVKHSMPRAGMIVAVNQDGASISQLYWNKGAVAVCHPRRQRAKTVFFILFVSILC